MRNSQRKPSTKKYSVYVDDNFNFMDESERYRENEFDTLEEAIAKCQAIVERSLQESLPSNSSSAKKLFEAYKMFGEDPFIIPPKGADKVEFSAWEYAEKRAKDLVN